MKCPFPLFPIGCSALLASLPAKGAEITWSVFDITGDVSEVSNQGTTVIAASGANGGSNHRMVDNETVATVNGVTFTDAYTMDGPTHMDTLSKRAGSSVTLAYGELLRYADRHDSGRATWTFKGLKVGKTYQIQIWNQDLIQTAGEFGIVLNNGGLVPPVLNAPGHALILCEASGENTPGQYALGTFVADATTQQFQAQAYNNLKTTPALVKNVAVNAYQLRDLGVKGAAAEEPKPSPAKVVVPPPVAPVEVPAEVVPVEASNGPITWTAHNITNSVGNVSQKGTLHEARAGAAASQFVNGTLFESTTKGGNLFDSLSENDSLGERGYGSVVKVLSYRIFLKYGQRSGRPNDNAPPRIASTRDWATVTFSGLTVGNRYEIQIWASDVGAAPDGVAKKRALVLGDGAAVAPAFGRDAHILYEATDFGAGQYGTGTFVAEEETQSFHVQAYDNVQTKPVALTQEHMSNGWQIRDLGPE